MKKIITYSFLSAAILFTSCKKILDKLPTDAQPGDEVLKSSANVLSVLAASYNSFSSNNFEGGQVKTTAELYGDQINFVNVTGGAPAQFVSRSFNTFNQIGRDVWSTGYNAIGRANVVLKAITENSFSDTTDAVKKIWQGEALFIRAVSHFELVRLYAKPYTSSPETNPGVVLRLKALTASEAQQPKPRNTVKETYDAVIADLKQAEMLLPASNSVRATKWAAKAYLARVYFSMADYPNAFLYSNDVITNSGYVLGSDVRSPFNTTGNLTSLPTGAVFMALGDASNLRGNFFNLNANNTFLPIATSFYTTITSKGGTRATLLTAVTTNTPPRGISLKYALLGDNAVNVPVIKLSEMYLTRAESRVQTPGFVDATVRADYNAVRAVAGVAADNTTTGATGLLSAIRSERSVELFTEGDGYHELRRLKLPVRGIPYDDATGLLKIPDGEVRVNLNIVQN